MATAVVSEPDILSKMKRGWAREPVGVTAGSDETSVIAARWTQAHDHVQEVWRDADTAVHTVPVILSDYRAELWLDGRPVFERRLRAGDVYLVRAGAQPRAVTRGRLDCLHLYVPDILLRRTAEDEAERCTSLALVDPGCLRDPVVDRIGREMMAEMGERLPFSKLRMDALGLQLVVHLLRAYSTLAPRAVGVRKGGLSTRQLRLVMDRLAESFADDVRLAELAALAGVSQSHLCRAFKESVGLPPHRWRHQRRIERACALLERTNLPVTEVAAQVGYDDPSQLAAAFRKALGVTPSRYRRERRS